MVHLIDKDALVAEINRLENNLYYEPENFKDVGAKMALDSLKSSLNTLEVKEVDLEKEIQRQYNVHKNPDNSIAKGCVIMTKDGFEYFAKHFLELGLSASNPTTAADRWMAEEVIINLKRIESDYRIDLTKEIEWVRNQVKKGE